MADKKTTAKKDKKPNVFVRFFRYLRECVGEIKKITWTSPKATTRNFLIVVGVIIVVGLFIFALDFGLFKLLGLFIDLNPTVSA